VLLFLYLLAIVVGIIILLLSAILSLIYTSFLFQPSLGNLATENDRKKKQKKSTNKSKPDVILNFYKKKKKKIKRSTPLENVVLFLFLYYQYCPSLNVTAIHLICCMSTLFYIVIFFIYYVTL
jgi:hypothetical protein